MTRYKHLLTALGTFTPKATIGKNSEAIFRSVEEQATQDVWYAALCIPRTWIAEHSLICLHVWMLHNRAKLDYNVRPEEMCGRRMQEELFERLWEDTILRVRNAGVAEVSVNKQLENVQKITFNDMYGYDTALRTVDEDDGLELAAAVWRGVFREDEAADTEAVLRLADYVRREVANVCLQPREDVYRGWVSWGPAVGETTEMRVARQRAMLEGEWREAFHPDGRLYFYHTATGERRWDPPPVGFYARRRFAITKYMESHAEMAPRFPALAEAQTEALLPSNNAAAQAAFKVAAAAAAAKKAAAPPPSLFDRFFG